MDNFTNTFNIISGVCSIISLFIGIFVANKVTKFIIAIKLVILKILNKIQKEVILLILFQGEIHINNYNMGEFLCFKEVWVAIHLT